MWLIWKSNFLLPSPIQVRFKMNLKFVTFFFFCIIHHTPLPWWSHYLQCPSFGEDDRKALKTACTTSSFFIPALVSLSSCNEPHYVQLPQRCCCPEGAALRPLGRRVWKHTVNTQHPLGCFIKATRGLAEVWRRVCGIFVWIPGVCLHASTLLFL